MQRLRSDSHCSRYTDNKTCQNFPTNVSFGCMIARDEKVSCPLWAIIYGWFEDLIWTDVEFIESKKSWIWNFPTEECRTFVWGTVFYATYNESKSGNFWSSWPSFWNGFRWMWQWQNEHLWQLQRLIPSRAIFFISSSIPSRCLKW